MDDFTRGLYLGFICANGRFSYYKNVKISPSGSEYNINEFRFFVKGERADIPILEGIVEMFGVGKVIKRRTLYFVSITSYIDLYGVVVPALEYNLSGYRRNQFDQWAEALENHYKERGKK